MTEAWTDHALKALRAACHTADGPSLLALLRMHDRADVLQQCGDALTAAAAERQHGRARAWLADHGYRPAASGGH